MTTPKDRSQLVDALAAWLLNRDDDLDLDNEFGVNMVQGGGSQEHSGDCTKEPWPCVRCIADKAVEDARKILSAIDAAGLMVCPLQPTDKQERAMSGSVAHDDEGDFPRLGELIDFSGENKLWTVLRAAYRDAIAASPYRAEALRSQESTGTHDAIPGDRR